MPRSWRRSLDPPRHGIAWLGWLGALAAMSTVAAGTWYFVGRGRSARSTVHAIVQPAVFGHFTHEVTERGEIESSSNIEIRCLVKARTSGAGGATSILEIVPEGTFVKPGDFLVRFDSSALENERTQQQIVCNTSQSNVIQARSTFETAVIAKKEYLEGTFKQEEKTLESEVFVAEENLRKAQDYVDHSQKLAAKGYVTALQLDADRFAVEKAKKDLEIAETKLIVLREFSKEKQLKQFEADIATSEAKLKSEEDSHGLDIQKLAQIDQQIKNCNVTAPQSGQVVYGNDPERRSMGGGGGGGNEGIIEEGAMVRENQIVIRLPDPTQMQVRAKINESQIDLVQEEMTVRIKVDAFPNLQLRGTVTKVEDFPAPRSWFNSNVKEYGALIGIENPPAGLRPGMTSEVKILVDAQSDVVQVPVQAVLEHESRHFVLQPQTESTPLAALPVELGSTNDQFVVIRTGLKRDLSVVMNPRAFLQDVSFPKAPPRPIEKVPTPTGDRLASTAVQAEREAEASTSTSDGKPEGETKSKRRRGDRAQGDMAAGGANFDPAAMVPMMMQRMDKDSDGKVSQAEWPAERAADFATTDANADGGVDTEEMTSAVKKMMERMQSQGSDGGSPGAGASGASP